MVGYLYLFIAALMRETSESRPHSTSSSSQYVLNAIKYIQFNYSHDISIDDVAKSVASPGAICTGCSCSMWARAPSTI